MYINCTVMRKCLFVIRMVLGKFDHDTVQKEVYLKFLRIQ